MTITPGRLKIKCNSAILTRDCELFGKMSPFIEFKLGTQVKSTDPHKKGGKTPNWQGECIELEIYNEPDMQIAIYDYEPSGKHDLVGNEIYFLDNIIKYATKEEQI